MKLIQVIAACVAFAQLGLCLLFGGYQMVEGNWPYAIAFAIMLTLPVAYLHDPLKAKRRAPDPAP